MRMVLRLVAASALVFAGCDQFAQPPTTGPDLETSAPEPLPELVEPAPELVQPAAQPLPPAPLQTQLSVSDQVSFEPADAPTLHEIESLRLRFGVVGAEGSHPLRLELRTPAGATYQVFEQELIAEPHAEAVATFELPIAGTVIDTYNLGGVWTAHLFIDGRELTTRTFELQP